MTTKQEQIDAEADLIEAELYRRVEAGDELARLFLSKVKPETATNGG